MACRGALGSAGPHPQVWAHSPQRGPGQGLGCPSLPWGPHLLCLLPRPFRGWWACPVPLVCCVGAGRMCGLLVTSLFCPRSGVLLHLGVREPAPCGEGPLGHPLRCHHRLYLQPRPRHRRPCVHVVLATVPCPGSSHTELTPPPTVSAHFH